MKESPTDHLVKDQFNAIAVDMVNATRILNEQAQQSLQHEAFIKALEQIDRVHNFISTPENILGSDLTKHGEIAEQVEVGVRNARAALAQQDLPASFDGIGRTAPADYSINGIDVQSKFINGTSNNLDHVLKHMDKYADFGRDGSYYHIPKDHHETVMRVINGENIDDLSAKTVKSIQDKVNEIERETGKSFTEVVKPGISDYSEVQQGKVHDTLNKHEQDLKNEQSDRKEKIYQDHQASLSEGMKVAGIGAAIGGASSLGLGIYKKYKEGKNPFKGEFTADDWKELGLTTAKGSVGGAFTGGGIYALTNYADLSAPFAGAVVSAIKGVGSLTISLSNGDIDFDEFMSQGLIVCAESAIVGLATAAGATLIPIPVIGAVIGSIAGKMLADFATGKTKAITEHMQKQMSDFVKNIDEKTHAIISQINAEFEKIGDLTKAAFDIKRNIDLLEKSIELARLYGVPENKIMKSENDLDAFMLS